MDEHQHRLWLRMLKTIERYRGGTISLSQLVGGLEAAFDAGEFRNLALAERFYDLWQPLEITNAVKGNTVTYQEIVSDVEAMRDFLIEHLNTEQTWTT